MSDQESSFGLAGQPSPKQQPTPPVWQSWKSGFAHPDSPSGGGGPGNFGEAQPLAGPSLAGADQDTDFVPPHPEAPVPLKGDKTPKITGASPKDAPVQKSDETAVELVKKKTDLLDVDVKYQVMADEIDSSVGGAVTGFDIPFPDFSPPDEPNEGDPGTMTWKITIEIRSKYQSEQMRGFFSCYGRGTTQSDRDKGDITVGFHESCHREDYVNYLNDNPLPALPDLKPDMTLNEFNTAQNKFTLEYNKYAPAMRKKSKTDTDEVGHKKSKWIASGKTKCFKHNPKKAEG